MKTAHVIEIRQRDKLFFIKFSIDMDKIHYLMRNSYQEGIKHLEKKKKTFFLKNYQVSTNIVL